MADSLSPVPPGEQPVLERRRSRNPLRNMMQHLTVEPPDNEDGSPRRGSLIRRLSWRRSRSPSAHSDTSTPTSATVRNVDRALCTSCSSLAVDIESTLDEVDDSFTKVLHPGAADAFDKREHVISRLRGLQDDKWSTTCPLCKLFWSVHVPGDGDGDYSLSAFSSRDTNYLIDPVKLFDMDHQARAKARGWAPGYLAVTPKKTGPGAKSWEPQPEWFRERGVLYRTLPQVSPEPCPARERARSSERNTQEPQALLTDSTWLQKGIWGREIGRSADMSVARNWLHFCDSHHRGRCGRRQVAHELAGFKLIDCAQSPPRVVERLLSEDYVALSYVSGGNTTDSWPKAVRDAVTVTLDLGFRYLWVDCLCIDSSRVQERMHQIGRMDEIFEGAAVTIIAAHGKDAMQGLPGVGSTTRPEQPKYKFADGNVALVSSMRDPRLEIKESVWYTRGWTYQEGLVARRRLVFTGQQMYWECEGMSCPETLVLPLAAYYDRDQEKMCDFVRPGLFNGLSYIDGSWEVWKKLPQSMEKPSTLSIFRTSDQHVVEYTKRQLTYDEDSLSAFMGITRRLEKTLGKDKLGSIVGIPIWCPTTDSTARSGPPRTKLLFALTTSFWHHKGHDRPQRRRHLPSWTWAGWRGAVQLYSSIVVVEQDGTGREKKLLNHHYVSAKQLTRNDASSVKWAYSPEMLILSPDGQVAYDFSVASDRPPTFPPGRYLLRVTNPLVLDKVKARVHNGGWTFNDVCVDVQLSRGLGTEQDTVAPLPSGGHKPSAIREYVEHHACGEQMTVLWFVEEATILLLVVEKTTSGSWERVGRARMGFGQDARDVMRRFGSLEVMLNHLPLRRLGSDILIE
ncbi:Heterokaryon incompatibility [Metarhizium album ARSEF 1941]|uniref:Heterokaryon incompatibility n=1 Tax=Metarhizium album (strain ARSEF 1941) TaxID=1081103 RepID=A0A0B2X035_METAS|nr:Heterokaryon incompatibility [Metarhizium album ARSEF 1941]KHN98450.1 Heterokaryon incompatibility [Metarhizium album ARSEF 1941]